MFTDEQVKQLTGPLHPSAVKSRNQSGRSLSYIEGWHAIAEANRIFGFDAWTRETIELREVQCQPREIGQNKTPGWSVSYIARVRVMVDGVVREGVGAGHGIDKDVGLAHESAAKEAETDAMKRALMTFGNPFGLALYDKDQKNVSAVNHDALTNFLQDVNAATSDEEMAELLKTYGPDLDALKSEDIAEWRRMSALFAKKRSDLASKKENKE